MEIKFEIQDEMYRQNHVKKWLTFLLCRHSEQIVVILNFENKVI